MNEWNKESLEKFNKKASLTKKVLKGVPKGEGKLHYLFKEPTVNAFKSTKMPFKIDLNKVVSEINVIIGENEGYYLSNSDSAPDYYLREGFFIMDIEKIKGILPEEVGNIIDQKNLDHEDLEGYLEPVPYSNYQPGNYSLSSYSWGEIDCELPDILSGLLKNLSDNQLEFIKKNIHGYLDKCLYLLIDLNSNGWSYDFDVDLFLEQNKEEVSA